MKKIAATFLVLFLVVNAYAGFEGPGASQKNTPVKAVDRLADDSKIVLVGHLLKKLGDERYLFQDDTGMIEVEIDDEDFRGVKVTPQDKIRITGEVDRDGRQVTVEVDYLEKVK